MDTIVLAGAEFWRLRYLQAEEEKATFYAALVQTQAQLQLEKARQDAAQCRAAYQQALADTAKVNGFDPSMQFGWNDEKTALVPMSDTGVK